MKTPPDPGPNPAGVTEDPWEAMRAFTEARIALGRCGVAPPLGATLDFRLAHARARDAVHSPLDFAALAETLAPLHPVIALRSAAENRYEYLTRPDKGRRLSEPSADRLAEWAVSAAGYDLCLLIGDGLSPRAVAENAPPFLERFIAEIRRTRLTLAPLCLVEGARVAISDPVGAALRARCAVILIGERPGLSSPASMGLYLTHAPSPGKTDEARNCVSNVRPGGLTFPDAARKLSYLVEESLRAGFSGVALKDRMPDHYLPFFNTPRLPESVG